LDVESVEDLKRMLKEIGYSDRAVEEILKWYR
jgi:predicted Ser/Thr protein kinase